MTCPDRDDYYCWLSIWLVGRRETRKQETSRTIGWNSLVVTHVTIVNRRRLWGQRDSSQDQPRRPPLSSSSSAGYRLSSVSSDLYSDDSYITRQCHGQLEPHISFPASILAVVVPSTKRALTFSKSIASRIFLFRNWSWNDSVNMWKGWNKETSSMAKGLKIERALDS